MTIEFIASAKLPTPWALFTIHGFKETKTNKEHIALVLGDISNEQAVLTRVHSECLTGDALFSLRCDCGAQLQTALQAIAKNGCGVLLYLQQEGRGIGLLNKIKAYHLQDVGADTVEANEQLGFPADMRDYQICLEIFKQLGIKKIRLMTNNPKKLAALEKSGIEVVERVPLKMPKNPHNEKYLATKAGKLGHWMDD